MNFIQFHYDEGWNDRLTGVPYTPYGTRLWREGWLACDDTPNRIQKDISYVQEEQYEI